MAKDSVPANQQKNSNAQSQNSNQQPAEETVVEPPDEFLWRCVIENDSEGFAKRLDDEEDEFIAALQEEMKKRNDEGRLPLDVAVILDRSAMVNELITRGVDINAATEKGTHYFQLVFITASTLFFESF
jgi:ankyrin repeat protein